MVAEDELDDFCVNVERMELNGSRTSGPDKPSAGAATSSAIAVEY